MDSDYYNDFMDSDYYDNFLLLFSIATNYSFETSSLLACPKDMWQY